MTIRSAPVTLIAPNYYAGRQARWVLARDGGYLNVRSLLLSDVATQVLSGPPGGAQPLTPVLEESAVRARDSPLRRRACAARAPPHVAPDAPAVLP